MTFLFGHFYSTLSRAQFEHLKLHSKATLMEIKVELHLLQGPVKGQNSERWRTYAQREKIPKPWGDEPTTS